MKFRYRLKNKHTLKIEYKVYTLNQIQEGGLKDLFNVDDYDITSVDRYTGFSATTEHDSIDLFENDDIFNGNVISYEDGAFFIEEHGDLKEWVYNSEFTLKPSLVCKNYIDN